MRKVELLYVEVLNETEQIFIFETVFNKQKYAQMITLNTALPIKIQDLELGKVILSLANMTRENASTAIDTRNVVM